MQEYVTSWTKNVVTNIKSSVETTMDKFGIAQSLGSSMEEEEVKETDEKHGEVQNLQYSVCDKKLTAYAIYATGARILVCFSQS